MTRVEKLREGWRQHVAANQARERSKTAPPYLYASGWHPCDRKLALDLIAPEDREEFGHETLERFDRGVEIERMMVARLMRAGAFAGFQVEAGQKRYEILGRDLRHDDGRLIPVIVGKIDGMIRFGDDVRRPIPFDVKSGISVQHCRTVEDLRAGRWTRGMLYQLVAYCYAEAAEVGLLVIDKPAGPEFIEVRLENHLEEMEEFLAAAEVAVLCQAERQPTTNHRPEPALRPPDRAGSGTIYDHLLAFVEDRSECFTCDHRGKSCNPPMEAQLGYRVINDEEVRELAETVTRLAESGREFNKADRAIKKKLRGVELGSICGEYDVVGKWQKSSKTVYPEACASCGAPVEPTTETNERGRFKVEVIPREKEAE
jgi:hypothetical protein